MNLTPGRSHAAVSGATERHRALPSRRPTPRGSLRALLLLIPLAVALPAAGEDFELLYDASLGTLPSAQGWTHTSNDPVPLDGLDEGNYSVAAGVLTQGPTGGPNDDVANVQYYSPPAYDYSFDEDTLEVELRLRIVESTLTLPGGGQPRSGFTVYLKDNAPRGVFISFGPSEVFLGSPNSQVSEIVSFDTTAGFADYLIRVDGQGATLSINGKIVAFFPLGSFATAGVTNFLGIGDVFDDQRGSAELESFRFSRIGPDEPFARDVTIVTETFASFMAFNAERAQGFVACPTGTRALAGGASILSNTGSDETMRLEISHPSDPVAGGGYAGWFAELVRDDPLVPDSFEIEVHALCGEVPGHVMEVEPGFPSSTPPLECPPGLSQIGGRTYETDETDHLSCAAPLGWITRTVSTGPSAVEFQELNLECPAKTYLIGGEARIDDFGAGIDFLGLAESHPETLFTDQPVLWVARAWRDRGPPLDPWQLEVDVWCAPKADPTEHRSGLVGRWQGSDIGVDDDMGRRDGTFRNGAGGVPGFAGFAFELERVNQEWIEIEQSADFYPEGDFTVDAWIQTDDVDPLGDGHVIAELYELGGDPVNPTEANSPNWWNLQLTPEGFLEGRVRRLSGTVGTIATGDVDLADGQPHHVAMQRSGGAIRLFVDGMEAAETFIQNSWDGQPFTPQPGRQPDPVSIGARRDLQSDATIAHWEGLIDDVKFHDRGLDAFEIAEIAGCGLPILPRVFDIDGSRHGGRAAALDETRLCAFLEPGTYEIEILSEATDAEARFTAWSEGPGQPWKTRVEAKPEVDADFGFGDATGAATAQQAFANTSPTIVPFTLTASQRVHFGIEEEGPVLDNRGGVSFRITSVPEPGFALSLAVAAGLLAARGRDPRCVSRRGSSR